MTDVSIISRNNGGKGGKLEIISYWCKQNHTSERLALINFRFFVLLIFHPCWRAARLGASRLICGVEERMAGWMAGGFFLFPITGISPVTYHQREN